MSKRQFAHFVPPTSEMVEKFAARLGVQLDEEDARLLPSWLGNAMAALENLEDVEETSVPIDYTHRDPGRMPGAGEDPHNAFVRFCDVRGSGEGLLKGKRLAVKDCVAVAGVPQSEGGGRRPYFVPTEDAVVIERVLRAGATIIGKTNMEDMAVGSGEGSYFGAARNALHPTVSTGGSSSGSAAAVVGGMADMALGVDQAGSIRIPAAWCGLVGMKATHGLVPSYGLTYMETIRSTILARSRPPWRTTPNYWKPSPERTGVTRSGFEVNPARRRTDRRAGVDLEVRGLATFANPSRQRWLGPRCWPLFD